MFHNHNIISIHSDSRIISKQTTNYYDRLKIFLIVSTIYCSRSARIFTIIKKGAAFSKVSSTRIGANTFFKSVIYVIASHLRFDLIQGNFPH